MAAITSLRKAPEPAPDSTISTPESAGATFVYRSSAFAAAHETFAGLHAIGLLSDDDYAARTSEAIETLSAVSPDALRALRAREDVSATVLAYRLGVPSADIESWEGGVAVPSGPVLVLLRLVEHYGLGHIA